MATRTNAKKKKKNFHATLVPALDALIGDPLILEPEADTRLKANTLLIPAQYKDRLRDFSNDTKNIGRAEAAKSLLKSFAHIMSGIYYSDNGIYVCKNNMQIRFVCGPELESQNINKNSTTDNALATARYYYDSHSHDIAVMTGDDFMIMTVLLAGIDVARVNPEYYTGRRKLVMPVEAYDAWFTKGYLKESQFEEFFPEAKENPLKPNEFVEFVFEEKALLETYKQNNNDMTWRIGRFEYYPDGDIYQPCLQQLHFIKDLPHYILLRTPGQAMFAEALLAPVELIPIVICPAEFGTGKTFLTSTIGIILTAEKNPRFDRIFVCPRDSRLGQEIGFLPGDERLKVLANSMPIVDNVREYIKIRGDKKAGGKDLDNQAVENATKQMLEKYFEFIAIIHMGGRSITDSWIIYDEAQDMERFQIIQLMKRIGDNSKMIITGDPNQVYNPHMNYHSNGLNYAAVKMAGSPYAAVVTMTKEEITRSVAAQEIARRLEQR